MAGKSKGQMSGATVLGAFGLTAAIVQAFGYARWAGVLMVIANLVVVWQALVRAARRWMNRARRAALAEQEQSLSACSTCGSVNEEPCDAGLHS